MVVAGEMLHDYSDEEICSDIGRSSGPSGGSVFVLCKEGVSRLGYRVCRYYYLWIAIVDQSVLFVDMCSSAELGIPGGPGLTS